MSHINVASQTITPEMATAAVLSNPQSIIQVCPIQKGNPVITFEIDLYNGFVVCGLASGAVDCWVLPFALGGPMTQFSEDETKHEIDKFSKQMTKDGTLKSDELKYSKYYCRRLIHSDYESVRHIYLKHHFKEVKSKNDNENNIDSKENGSSSMDDIQFEYEFKGLSCVIGDKFVREWESYESIENTYMEYEHTSHDASICEKAQIIGHKSEVILYPQFGHRFLIYVNLENTALQKQIKLPYVLGRDCTIMDFDGNRIVYKKIESNGHKTIGLIDLNKGNIDNDMNLIDKGKFYHTSCHADDSNLKWVLNKSSKEYWGFQLNDKNKDRIAYISNQNIIKIYSISKNNIELRLAGHKAGYILAFQHKQNFIVSLANDRTIRVWYIGKIPKKKNKKNNNNNGNTNNGNTNGNDEISKQKEEIYNLKRSNYGRCIYIKENIVGSFVPGYIYKIVMINRMIFYSSDNGIFGFNVQLPQWCL